MGRIVGRQQRGRDGEEIERGRHEYKTWGKKERTRGKLEEMGKE